MKTYKVNYNGNASKFKDFEFIVNANSPREAVEDAYMTYMDSNYFPQEDGSIQDCDGEVIADPGDDFINYDGGTFEAEEITEDEI